MKQINNFEEKFKNILKIDNLGYKIEKRNNDYIYYKEIDDFHNQEEDSGTDSRFATISNGTAHRAPIWMWGTTFRFYNFLKWFKKSHLTVVDMGCDKAFIRRMIHSGTYYTGTNYVGLDLRVSSLRKASDKMPNCNNPAAFITHDLHDGLPFLRKKSVDIILCMEVIEHLKEENGRFLMKEMYRVLKPGGLIYLSQPNHDPTYWYAIKKYRGIGYPFHIREYTVKEFIPIIKEYNFELLDMFGNVANRKRLINELKSKKLNNQLKLYNRLCDIMGHEIPTQVIGQMHLNACGGVVYILKKPEEK